MIKKLIILLLTVLLLSSCTVRRKKQPDNGKIIDDQTGVDVTEYYEALISYKVRERNINNTVDNQKFEDFLNKSFLEMVSSDFLSMHFNVIDYKKFGIEKPEPVIGEVEYKLDEEGIQYYRDLLDELHGIDYDSLSYDQQLEYQNIEYTLYETICDLIFYKYNFLLDSVSNVLEDVVSNLTDYTFYDKESVDDYMNVADDFDDYVESVITFTQAQAKDGYPMTDEWIDYTQEFCGRAGGSIENNELILSFDKRIDALDFLSDEEKKAYKEKNRETVLNDMIPMFSKVSEAVEKYRGKAGPEDYLPYKLNPQYARIQYALYTSNNADIDALLLDTEDCFSQLEAEITDVYYNEDYYNLMVQVSDSGVPEFYLPFDQMLEYLKDKIRVYMPDLGDASYTVDYINADTASEGTIAYYWPSPIDNLDQNIIRVNPNSAAEGYEMYGTIAHEGIPGHLYQNLYFYKTEPDLYRSVIGYTGYAEGWAVYSSYYAYRTVDLPDPVATALYYLDTYYFFEYSIIDLMANYYGYSAKQIYDYFDKNSIFTHSLEYITSIRSWVIENPYVYCSYGIGASEMFRLRDKAMKELGDKFDLVSFHDKVVINGPLPYVLLESCLDEYIASVQ